MKLFSVLLAVAFGSAPVLFAADEPYVVDTTKVTGWVGNPQDWTVAADATGSTTSKEWIHVKPGTGVLLNGTAGKAKDLISEFQHGDVEAEIECLFPKGSNSGVYFQNRYEVQILDSFGKADDAISVHDMGAIYERWDEKRDPKGYEGTKPLKNATKPAGEWQTLHIIFRAPRFDATGTKTANAKFELVELNGVVIHRDVEVSGPTRGGLPDEVAKGPIRLQGDHGPIAFRKLVFKPL
jgi:hypothetical protein